VEKNHQKLLEEVPKESTEDSTNYYVCQVCGHVAAEKIPTSCPVCNAVQKKFRLEY
jgi:rubrerythrin